MKTNKKAISLIVLVITILVLTILASTVIIALNNTNIISKASDATKTANKNAIIEAISVDVMSKRLENLGKVDEADVLEILEKYGTLSSEKNLQDKTMIAKDGKISIAVSEILEKISWNNFNKTFSIIGDSYSTFKGYTYPLTNIQWYPTNDSASQGYNKGDVTKVEETYWYLFSKATGYKLEQNNSYSGSAISYDGYGDGTSDGKDTSFCKRVESIPDSDLILIFGGTNDFFINVSQGDYKYSDWTETDKEKFRPALAYLINYLQTNHPNSKLVFILNTEMSESFNTSIETICNKYNIDLLKLVDIDKENSHPTIAGMQAISSQLVDFLNISETPNDEKVTLSSKVKIGEYVKYVPDTSNSDSILASLTKYSGSSSNTTETLFQETMNWKVLDVENGNVRLISEAPTGSKVEFKKYNGYNNVVYLLDNICKTLYDKQGYTEKVQNLKLDDIEKYMMTKPVYSSKTYSPETVYCPSILKQEKDQTVKVEDGIEQVSVKLGLSEQNKLIEQKIFVKPSEWALTNKHWNQEMTSSSFQAGYYNLFIANEQNSNYEAYYLSSRCPGVFVDSAYFAVRYIHDGKVDATTLCDTYDNDYTIKLAFRPVVTLKSDVLIKSGDGTSKSPYVITLSN